MIMTRHEPNVKNEKYELNFCWKFVIIKFNEFIVILWLVSYAFKEQSGQHDKTVQGSFIGS